jgi:NAD(P)H-dependent FMN reductase
MTAGLSFTPTGRCGMHSSSADDGFYEAEQRVETSLYRDYREAGEALRQIRDEQRARWLTLYGTWTHYLNERLGICRQTAAYMIRAAEVAADLSSRDDTLRLPARHANLLARFDDSEVRLNLAIKIQHLSFKEAARLVIDFSKELMNKTTTTLPKAGRNDERSEALAQLDGILRSCRALDTASLAQAASRLEDGQRRRLERRVKAAARKLKEVSATLGHEGTGS